MLSGSLLNGQILIEKLLCANIDPGTGDIEEKKTGICSQKTDAKK